MLVSLNKALPSQLHPVLEQLPEIMHPRHY